jgi:glycosyltransferase involved in cell wall biosynthesis
VERIKNIKKPKSLIMKKKIPTVTVAVSAFNEEENIRNFLKSILMQKEDGFILKHIWVFDDGSNDKTVVKAKKFRSKKLTVFTDNKRVGKSSRLNEIYKKLDTDFLVQSDADVIFSHPFVVRDVIQPLIHNKKVYMTAGHEAPIEVKTFFEKAINTTFSAYTDLRFAIRKGNNVFSAIGEILAYKKEFVKQIHIPEKTIANDIYTYFCCITKGYEFVFVLTAVVLFRFPQNVRDHIRQNTRFVAAPLRMEKLFSKELVKQEYSVSPLLYLKVTLKQFFKHPVLSLYIFIINLYCKMKAKGAEKKLTAVWPMAVTTKQLTIK